MDPEPTAARIFSMRCLRVLGTLVALGLTTIGLALIGLAGPQSAEGAIGVVGSSPNAGKAGRSVEVTVDCGACKSVYIVKGAGHPPRDFPILLVPLVKAPKASPCGDGRNGVCAPTSIGPPRRHPFVFLGRAQPTFRESELEGISRPEYRLQFQIPNVNPGVYVFVIYCAACYDGLRGSLIADPVSRRWRLWVRQSDTASASASDAASGVAGLAGVHALAILIGELF